MSAPTKSESVQYNDTDIIFEQGDIGFRAYKIISGSVAVLIGYGPIALRKQVTLLLPGQSFGSVALHSPTSQRTATCIARGTTTLQITSTSNTISKTEASVPRVPRVPTLLSMFQKKPLASITQKTAASVDAEAASVDAKTASVDTEAASINTQQVTYSKGQFIVREGDINAASWFVITKGCVDVNVKTEKVGSMTEGEVFGESAILRQDKTRTASVVARDDVTVLQMSIDPDALQQNAGLREMLERRRNEIEKKNYLREFNCQTERTSMKTVSQAKE